jgi:hypothetical protein
MGVTDMRFLMIAVATAFLLLPVAQQASACGASHAAQISTEAAATDLSAAKKKPAKIAKKKKEKVEYMRSAAGPEPVVKKTKKHKKHKNKKK